MTAGTWKDVVILYVEDESQNYEEMFSLIQEHCSERSRHTKSRDAARKLIESGECKPHFAILDRKILYYDQEGTVAAEDAGDMLYSFLLSYGIPVLLMTAMEPEVLEMESPYRTDRPPLGYMKKLPNETSLREAMTRYLDHMEKSEHDGTAR